MTTTIATITPQVGQTWRSRDPRDSGRTITIIYFEARKGILYAAYKNTRGERRTIRADRLCPVGYTKGYDLVVSQ